tara:strand:+ start:29540 stop:30319 length:780 start_codon:yes stop_codon:yes gene_type:complete
MNLELTNLNAVVCGSTQGIGLATAEVLAKLGANIYLLARNETKLKQISQRLDNTKGQVHNYLCIDFQNSSRLEQEIKKIKIPIHILINNTGGPASGKLVDANLNEFNKAFEMHLINNHILVQHFVEGMKKEGFGRIVNVISTSVKSPIPGLGVSNTIRAAVANWAKTLSFELAEHGITVNNVLPGFTDTNRLKTLIEKKSKTLNKSVEEITKKMISSVPANRFGEAAEVADAIAFLCSPSASYINGINLPVDGGRTNSL